MLEIKFKKLHPNASIPKRGTDDSAGWDLTAISFESNDFGQMVTYDTGLSVEIPRGYMGLIVPRSSIYKTSQILSNSLGVIDSDYRGSIKFKFRCLEVQMSGLYQIGDRIGQLIIMPFPEVSFTEVENLSETERGEGGFGSTGIK